MSNYPKNLRNFVYPKLNIDMATHKKHKRTKKNFWQRMSRTKKCLIITALIVMVGVVGVGWWAYSAAYRIFDGADEVTVVIPPESTDEAVRDSLNCRLGDYGTTVYRLWTLRGGNPEKAAGVYRIARGDRAWSVAGRLRDGRSSTVTVTFTTLRTMDDLAARVAKSFLWNEDDFAAACDSILPAAGFAREQYPAAFWPNTYEFYGSESAIDVVKKLLDERNRFWNDNRRAKAKALGLTPVQVATVASIVEEESAKTDERPTIARLYMNRLDRGMKLQADPTVKFAIGDFTLRRITSKHTAIESPYNTYHVKGLPPGPIRIVDGATIDAVLYAPDNDYIYMCAKEDFSGRHNFAHDYATHQANARRYQKALDARGIH